MIKQSKIRNSQLALEPWAHEDDLIIIGGANQIDHSHSEAHTFDFQNNKGNKKSQQSLGKTNRKYYYIEAAKKGVVKDFVKKNLQDVKSHSIILSNYASILTDQYQSFYPINPRSTVSSMGRRPAIKTTCIGYFDQNPLNFQSPLRPRKNQSIKLKSSGTNFRNRPRTSDISLHHAKVNPERKHSQKNSKEENIFDSSALRVESGAGVHHLQKLLKIKQKLRQKLKKNSEKKDRERNQYLHIALQDNNKKESSPKGQTLSSENEMREKKIPIHTQKRSSREIKSNRGSRSFGKNHQRSFFAIIGGSLEGYEI